MFGCVSCVLSGPIPLKLKSALQVRTTIGLERTCQQGPKGSPRLANWEDRNSPTRAQFRRLSLYKLKNEFRHGRTTPQRFTSAPNQFY
jgi:hypothetical protein